ncbi:MAG TPA: hypothetical protein VEX15_20710 [Nocardioidaceae bacterium]|nr:hypothetical protein [Nocardioidaceae bacterium]
MGRPDPGRRALVALALVAVTGCSDEPAAEAPTPAARSSVTPGPVDPDGCRHGPEAHIDSSWKRPGDEWGTGIRFADPGCWQVTVRRDRGAGSVWFTVVDARR